VISINHDFKNEQRMPNSSPNVLAHGLPAIRGANAPPYAVKDMCEAIDARLLYRENTTPHCHVHRGTLWPVRVLSRPCRVRACNSE